jgi:2-keto-4-pentenoate hydratase/2-oxohepta-3-ene-1,7-dioic acid hydratase in catechol pathway
MKISAHQHWILLGTAPSSEEVWAVRHINFPCGYLIPPGSFVSPDEALSCPAPGKDAWAMAGFAFEISTGGKNIDVNAASRHIQGYRPWIGLFRHLLLDELSERRHSIHVWDHGVSIFYGLWQQDSQALGDLISVDEYKALAGRPVELRTTDTARSGSAVGDYLHSAEKVVAFMSDFMTLSKGDTYILGPLAALQTVYGKDPRLTLSVGSVSFSVGLEQMPDKKVIQ